MLIESIEKGRNGKKKVLLDDREVILLYDKEVKKYGLKVGEEITERIWGEILQLLEIRGKKWIFHLLAKKDYTISLIENKLRKVSYPESVIRNIVEYFLEKNFLDDKIYIEKYYKYYKHYKSKRIIEQDLMKKGVTRDILKEFFDISFDEDIEKKTALNLLKKKMRYKVKEDSIKFKMIKYLADKGFDYSMSKEMVENYWNEEEQDM